MGSVGAPSVRNPAKVLSKGRAMQDATLTGPGGRDIPFELLII